MQWLKKVTPQESEVKMVKKTSISLDEETFKLCEKYAAENSRSRSEFIASAIQKYISYLKLGRQKNIIAKELANDIVKGSEAEDTKQNHKYHISGETYTFCK